MSTWQWLREYVHNKTPAEVAAMVVATYYRDNPHAQDRPIPVPVRKIAEWLEVEVEIDDRFAPGAIDSSLDRPTAWLLNEPENQLRFSLAHLLGHLLLHSRGPHDALRPPKSEPEVPRSLIARLKAYWQIDPDRLREQEAHDFAVSLLMPAEWFFTDAYNNGIDPVRLSKKYQVSYVAAVIRLKMLRCLP